MSYAEKEFFEDFNFVFANTSQKNITLLQAVKRIQEHSVGTGNNANQVMFKITSFGNSATGMYKTLDYNSRQDDLTLYDNTDTALTSSEENKRPFMDFVKEVKTLHENAHRSKRMTMNFILSMKAGTPQKEFRAATREFLAKDFPNQPYLYTFHDDTDVYHAHVVAGLRDYEGNRVLTNKIQLQQWRENFAEALREQGVSAEATPALSRGKVSENNYLRAKEEIIKRGGKLLSKDKKFEMTNKIQTSLDARKQAWLRMNDYIKDNFFEESKLLTEFLSNRFDVNEISR